MPSIDAGIEVGLEDLDGVVGGLGPVKLEGADDSEFAEAGKIFRLDELFVGQGVREMGVSVGGAGSGNAVEGGFDGTVSDGMDVDDQGLLVGIDAEFVEFLLIEEQIAIVARVLVRLGQMRRLRRELGDAVGEDLDAGHIKMRNILVLLAGFLDCGQLGSGIFGEHLGKSDDL